MTGVVRRRANAHFVAMQDHIEISSSPGDVVIKFETHSPDGLAADPTIVFLSWPYAKRLALALSEFVNSYEKAVGQIPLLDKLPIHAGKEGVQQAAATLEEMPRDE